MIWKAFSATWNCLPGSKKRGMFIWKKVWLRKNCTTDGFFCRGWLIMKRPALSEFTVIRDIKRKKAAILFYSFFNDFFILHSQFLFTYFREQIQSQIKSRRHEKWFFYEKICKQFGIINYLRFAANWEASS